jgi:hypothetical protein
MEMVASKLAGVLELIVPLVQWRGHMISLASVSSPPIGLLENKPELKNKKKDL